MHDKKLQANELVKPLAHTHVSFRTKTKQLKFEQTSKKGNKSELTCIFNFQFFFLHKHDPKEKKKHEPGQNTDFSTYL